jgi:diguanylate cyclase (GGDEF)-like protein
MTDVKPLDDLLQELDNLPDVDDHDAAPPTPLTASKIDYRDYPVLVVDDEEENILAFQLNFRHDFTVDAATSGAEALERLADRTYAVVVTDQRMPGMSGVELLERTVDTYPHLIRIIVTGYTDNQSLIDAINMGRIYKYVTKPWSRDEMAVTIKRAIEAYSLALENDRLLLELQSKNEELEQTVAERTRKLREANARLHQLAITDGLTGLFNHRYFHEKWREEIKRSERYGEPVSLLIADVDFFKNYNDRRGHPRGDVLLRDLSMLLEQSFREVDVVARYGGEEFAIILPRTAKADAGVLADRIREQIADSKFPDREVQPDGRVTCSFGLAAFPEDGATASTVLERADQALYAAKQQGRNQVVVYQPGLPMPHPDAPVFTSGEFTGEE